MKKALCVLLTAVFIFSLAIFPALASEKATLELSPRGSAAVGSSMTVELYITGNPGFSSAQFTLIYNTKVLRCVQCSAGELLSDMLSAANDGGSGGAVIAAAGAEDCRGDGVLASFTFEVIAPGQCGFELKGVKLTNSRGEALSPGLGVLELSASSRTNEAPTPEPSNEPEIISFADIEGHWAEDSIAAFGETGIVNGYPDGEYRPDAPVTRAQFVTALWRAMGSPRAESEPTFVDLSPQGYYRAAVAWAGEKGIVRGIGAELFKTHGHISRQEAAVMLYRAAGSPMGGEMMFIGVYEEHYKDIADLAPWAKDAVYHAIYGEYWCGIGGREYGDVIGGALGLSRAEMAVMLEGFLR